MYVCVPICTVQRIVEGACVAVKRTYVRSYVRTYMRTYVSESTFKLQQIFLYIHNYISVIILVYF